MHKACLPILVIIFLLPTILQAQGSSYRSGEMIRVAPDDTLHTQLFAAGQWVVIQGSLQNDLFAAGQDVVLDGQIGDDAFLAGRSVSVRGVVRDMLMAAGETVVVDNQTDGDVFLAGRSIHLTEDVSVGGQLMMAGDQIQMEGGSVAGSTRIAGREVALNGQFEGPVEIHSSNVTFGESYQAAGMTRIVTERELDRNELGAAPSSLEIEVRRGRWFTAGGFIYVGYLLSLMATGLILLLMFRPAFVRLHEHAVGHVWMNLGVGFVASIAIPFLLVLLLILVLTIPLAVIIGAFYGFALFFSPLLAALALGMLILGRYFETTAATTWYGSLVVGLLLIGLLTWIPVIGTIIVFLILFFGLGSIITYLWSAYRREDVQGDPGVRDF